MQGGPDELGKFLYSGQIDLKIVPNSLFSFHSYDRPNMKVTNLGWETGSSIHRCSCKLEPRSESFMREAPKTQYYLQVIIWLILQMYRLN